jgi:hypothetical protein
VSARTQVGIVEWAWRIERAWVTELWKSIVPLLHDSSVELVGADTRTHGTDPESVLVQLDDGYGAWQADASPVAEAPIIRVLGLVMRDHEDEAAG